MFLAKVLARCVQTLMLLIYCGATAAPARFDTQLHPCIYEFTNVPFPIVTRLLLFFIYFLAADRLGGAACSSKQKVTRMNLRPLNEPKAIHCNEPKAIHCVAFDALYEQRRRHCSARDLQEWRCIGS